MNVSEPDDMACRIYQSLLDGTGDAVHLNDFDRYVPFFHFPHHLETFEGRILIATAEDLRRAFEQVQDGLRVLGVVRLVRTCTVAQFYGPDTIRGYHDTHLLDAEKAPREAYSGMITLRRRDGQWRVAGSQFIEDKASLPTMTLRSYAQGPVPKDGLPP